jgi:transposase
VTRETHESVSCPGCRERDAIIARLEKLAEEQISALERLARQQAAEIERLEKRVAELEAKLGQDSTNSHRPPSSDPPFDKPKKDKKRRRRKRGAQPGRDGKHRQLFAPERVDQTVDVFPTCCPECAGELAECDGEPWRHQVVELPDIRAHVTEYRMHQLCCTGCQKVVRAGLPDGVSRSAFGPRLQAATSLFTGSYQLSKRNAQKAIRELFDVQMSLGSVSNLEARQSQALRPTVELARRHVVDASSLNIDETGWKQAADQHWLWVVVGDHLVVYHIDKHRSREVLDELVPADFDGTITSDRYSVYNGREPAKRQICWAHLMRDLNALRERDGPEARWAGHLLCIAELIFMWRHKIKRGDCEASKLRQRIDSTFRPATKLLLERASGEQDAPEIFERLLEREAALWTFACVEGVEPTNNEAERALRSAVIWRKTSFGTQSGRGSRFVERMMTCCGSLRRQGREVFDFLVQAAEHALGLAAQPRLLPQ